MDNGCKTYQQATLEMVWLGTQCRSIDVIYAVVDQKNFFGGPPPPPPPISGSASGTDMYLSNS